MCLLNVTSIALGAATLAASFFILRKQHINSEDLKALERRIEELEADRMLEAYRKQGVLI